MRAMSSRIAPELLERLQRLDLAVGRLHAGDVGGRRESKQRGSGTEFLEHRSYAPGDDPRRVDWNAYARLGELHVKEFTAEARLHLVIAVDVSPSMDHGRFNKLSRARELAACLGFVALRRLDRVSVVPLGSPGGRGTTYQGRARTMAFLEDVLALAPGSKAAAADDLATFLASFDSRPDLVLVTDLLGRANRRELLRRAGARSRRATCVHLVDPEEEGPELGGRIRLVDAETGRTRVLRVDRETSEAYRERFAAHLVEVRAECRSARLGYVRLSTAEPPEQAVLSTLRKNRILQ